MVNVVHVFQQKNDRHVDIIEIDAASHTGVDDMRELTEGVRYKPSEGQV